MHFQIYIPGARDVAPELADVGLPELVANAEALPAPDGPDGKGGAIFAWWPRTSEQRQIGYRPDVQQWAPSPDGKYWAGVWTGSPPRPEELVRANELGKRFTLGDGNLWLVPSLEMVPREMAIGTDGVTRYEMPKRFSALMESRMQWFERVVSGGDGASIRFDDLADLAAEALRLNYRMTREVVRLLRLFNTRTLPEVCNFIFGGAWLAVPGHAE